jgi:50S ribosomal protein L16 3-hydroxylase
VLQPGDVLYVPPGVAHWGVALGEAIAYSLGFRAPSVGDLVARRTDAALELISTTSLLEDGASLRSPSRPGEITVEHIANAREAINNALDALDSGQWFGEVMTEGDGEPDHPYPVAVLHGERVRLHPATRIAWREREDTIDVFIDGGHCEAPLNALGHLIALCSGEWIQRRELARTNETLFETLCEASALTDEDST